MPTKNQKRRKIACDCKIGLFLFNGEYRGHTYNVPIVCLMLWLAFPVLPVGWDEIWK